MTTLTPTMNIMIGIPGSGKSTLVKKITSAWRHKRFVIISPDDLRECFCDGDRGDQSKNTLVWSEAYSQVANNINKRYDIIFDATMVNQKARKKLLKIAAEANYYVIAHVVNTDVAVCKEQNTNRKWIVSDAIIDKMYKAFKYPTLDEGIDYIIAYN